MYGVKVNIGVIDPNEASMNTSGVKTTIFSLRTYFQFLAKLPKFGSKYTKQEHPQVICAFMVLQEVYKQKVQNKPKHKSNRKKQLNVGHAFPVLRPTPIKSYNQLNSISYCDMKRIKIAPESAKKERKELLTDSSKSLSSTS